MKSEAYPSEMAEEYEYLLKFYPEHYKLREKVAGLLQDYFKARDAIIIDIGCGTGETTKYILERCPKVKVIAIDKDKRMIERLKEKLKNFIENRQLVPVCKDIFKYIKEIEDSSLDGVTSSWTLHNFTKNDRNHLLKEIYRVLKPKGIFVNMDKYVFEDPINEQESFDKAVNTLKLIPNKILSKISIKHENDDRHPDIIMKEEESASEMKKIGFKEVKFNMRIGRETIMSCFK